jgi:RNA polymerase sigma-70 factor (sigma-E family)
MTTGGNDNASTHEDELLAHLFQQGTDRQAARYAATYNAEAGLTRFDAWLQEHTAADALATAIKAGAGAIRVQDVTEPLVATGSIGPDTFPASATASMSWSADHAFTELYCMHYRALVRLAVLLVQDAPTAEEVVQDSFIAMRGGWHRLGDADKALAYLRQAVVNRSRSILRHRTAVEKDLPDAPQDAPATRQEALDLLERSAIVAALRNLPDRQREAIVLRYYADLSEAEVAATMGISRGAAKSHTARGMSALRAALEQQ